MKLQTMSGTIANPPLWAYIEPQMKSANFFVHVLILIRMKSVEWNTRVPHPKAGNAAQNGAFLSVIEPLSRVAEVNSQAMIQHFFSTACLFSRVGSSSSHKCCAATREWATEYLRHIWDSERAMIVIKKRFWCFEKSNESTIPGQFVEVIFDTTFSLRN